jgi:DNA polymerase III epsilon subunit-like protein
MTIYFFDTETTGNTVEDRLIQLAIKERGVAKPVLNELFKPPMPIPHESSAVHHISNKKVETKSLFQESDHYQSLKEMFESSANIFVAHNVAFDQQMLLNENIKPTNTICTLKVARALDIKNTFTNYKLQYLRYALDMELEVPAHDALADVMVLEQLFEYLLKRIMLEQNIDEANAISKMMQITREPILMKTVEFGKHKGKTLQEISEIDKGYLQWLLAEKLKNPIGEEDWIYTLKHYLK